MHQDQAALVTMIALDASGWTALQSELPRIRRTSAIAFHRGWWRTAEFYHVDGPRYRVASGTSVQPLGRLSAVLAYTVYNPRVDVEYAYERIGPYALDQLKSAVQEAIDADDDVLTQFVEPDELKRQVAQASSFEALAHVLLEAGITVDAA